MPVSKNIAFRLLILASIFGTCVASNVQGATFEVNTSTDSHDLLPGDSICGDPSNPSSCSFRSAIEEANALAGPDTILVPVDFSPYRLRLGELAISGDSLLVRGQDGRPVIDGANNPFLSSTFRIAASQVRIEGLQVQRARRHGILIESNGNMVGGATSAGRNVIIGCGIDDSSAAAIAVDGAEAFSNVVANNYIGLLSNGASPYANCNGILLSHGAHDNLIGSNSRVQRNVISANSGYGIVVRNGAHDNVLSGNFIGPDATGTQGPGNGRGGVLFLEDAHHNRVGGHSFGERNIVSCNAGAGITLSGAQVVSNIIAGNLIGPDISGILPLGNQAAGILITDGAHQNLIGDGLPMGANYITGNAGDGVRISGRGCDSTYILGNFIGFDTSGFRDYGNGMDFGYGIYVGGGAGETVIGSSGPGSGNYVGGNVWGGIYLTESNNNRLQGNYIGVSYQSLSSAPNGAGIVLRNGSSYNLIGGRETGESNVISGNRADVFPFGAGIVMYDPGTSHNTVIGNKIGTDDLASRALRNGSAGVIIGNGASYNTVGGSIDGARNIIAGNGAGSALLSLGAGVHIYGDGTDYNRIVGNYIGCGDDTSNGIGNLGNGVGIYHGAQHNVVGGDSLADGNLIAFNDLNGVYVDGPSTRFNTIRFNRFRNNGQLSIALSGSSQNHIEPPVITSVADRVVSGYNVHSGATVDVYLAEIDPSGFGEGAALIATGTARIDGTFAIAVDTLGSFGAITAMVTDSEGNSSEFAQNAGSDVITGVGDDQTPRPATFSLSQNYPNPFNPSTRIHFSLPRAGRVRLSIFNLLGELVSTILNRELSIGEHEATWEGSDENGRLVASGIYLYRLEAEGFVSQKKMLLLR